MLYFPEMGIRVDSTNHISSILPGSVAAEEGTIAVGDRIISVRAVVTVNNIITGAIKRLAFNLLQTWRRTTNMILQMVNFESHEGCTFVTFGTLAGWRPLTTEFQGNLRWVITAPNVFVPSCVLEVYIRNKPSKL